MTMIAWALLGIAALIVILAILIFVFKRDKWKDKHETDYRAFFWMGLIWTLFGVGSLFFYPGEMFFFLPMGIAFLAIGAANKKKWKKKKRTKKELWLVVAGLVVLLIFGLLAYFLMV